MVFQHYRPHTNRRGYGKIDHVIYIDIVPDKSMFTDEDGEEAYQVKEKIARDVVGKIDDYLLDRGLAITIEAEDPFSRIRSLSPALPDFETKTT